METDNNPICPHCNVDMVLRIGTKGKPNFWGCVNFPRCRYTEQIIRYPNQESSEEFEERTRFTEDNDIRREMMLFFIKIAYFLIVSSVLTYFAPIYFQHIFDEMKEDFEKNNAEIVIRAKTNITKLEKEQKDSKQRPEIEYTFKTEDQWAWQKVRLEAEKREAEKIAKQQEIERIGKEFAQWKDREKKKAKFESQYKPRAECNDPMLEWPKSVECVNEKINAKNKFFNNR
jgi:ssDNA-binding Zn-finger/Zn-ribbon topoisomerase 1